LDDKAQTLSYEHYYPYGGTAIIAGKDMMENFVLAFNKLSLLAG
jgi:hypothetical protein